MKRIVANPGKCLACRTCELACAMAHADVEDLVQAMAGQRAKPRIYIEAAASLAVPLQCRHCDDAPCVRVCPSQASWRPDQAGPVLVQEDRCIGCAFCVQACPFGVIRLARPVLADAGESKLVVLKCDLCQTRQAAGLGPACVASCPTRALTWEEVDMSARRARAAAAGRIVADGFRQ